jgi:hypothetical protein
MKSEWNVWFPGIHLWGPEAESIFPAACVTSTAHGHVQLPHSTLNLFAWFLTKPSVPQII